MNPRKDLAPELRAIQERLGAAQGKHYWRSLEELADSPAFQELMQREFPDQASVWPDGLSRRQFLSVMGASLALAGLGGCSVRPAPSRKIVPYVRQPEEVVPGKPLFFATAMTLGGTAAGVLAESHLGRPTKVEGNPDHPSSLGATDVFAQASVLTLYDPDRSQNVTHLGQTSTWDNAFGELSVNGRPSIGSALRELFRRQGEGLRLLTETVVSPTLLHQLDVLRSGKYFPRARWHQYEPLGRESVHQGARMAFGKSISTQYDFREAKVVLSLDADFLACGPGSLRHVADFMAGRRVRTTTSNARTAAMNRLYVVETAVSNTGAKADHRLALRARDIEGFALAVTRKVADDLERQGRGELKQALQAQRAEADAGEEAMAHEHARWIDAVAEDLVQNRGRSIILAGDRQPPLVHLAAHLLNWFLDNIGQKRRENGRLVNADKKTVFHTAAVEAPAEDHKIHSLDELVHDMERGKVQMLLILGGNPAYTAPADLRFTERMLAKRRVSGRDVEKVPLRVHLSLYQDETSRLCHWHLPETHYLEAWSDARAHDGTISLVQPLIEPLYNGRSIHEVLAQLLYLAERFGERQPKEALGVYSGDEIVRGYWRDHWPGQGGGQNFDASWQQALHDGLIQGSDQETQRVTLAENWANQLRPVAAPAKPGSASSLEIVFQQDPAVYDGRFANNGWLQELPRPLTKLTWDNAAIMSPATARKLKVAHTKENWQGGPHGGTYTDLVELRMPARSGLPEQKVLAPVWIMPGHADNSVTVHLGYGRTSAGRVGNGVGFNGYLMRTSDQPWFAAGLEVRPTGKTYLMACTQHHHLMEQRAIVRSATLDHYHEHPKFAVEENEEEEKALTRVARTPLTMYEGAEPYLMKTEKRWGMVIDLTACVGCKSCVVACQAENNIPVVGKDQVTRGREMHWLRVDLYYGSGSREPEVPDEFHFQPVPCMHCENAPCEYVCPVEATAHSADGLNDMVYNRCVGTRFCQNNCPYKVRRFNFYLYADYATESLKLQYNPDVTVRSRGVMEKCTYCVQRIRQAEIGAAKENRSVRDGEILTACQAACPADAIVFGDLGDPAARTNLSKVRQWRDSPLNYALLEELNTKPRTTYLAALRNPNPKLKEG